jgi:hypothetical protein
MFKSKAMVSLMVMFLVLLSVSMGFAALDPADEALIVTGINAADASFYKIGGAILIVLAGIWGFLRVKRLLG